MQTVDALQKNELASESELFIYSDAGKDENAAPKVSKMREYIKTIDGFPQSHSSSGECRREQTKEFYCFALYIYDKVCKILEIEKIEVI